MISNDVGTISVCENLVYWKVSDFFSLPQSVDTDIESRRFRFKDDECTLGIWPNGCKQDSSEGWFGLYLYNCSRKDPVFRVRFGITGNRGQDVRSCDAEWHSDVEYFYEDKFMQLSELVSRRTEIAPEGHLRIICAIRPLIEDYTVEASTQTEAERGLVKLSQNLKEIFVNSKDCDLTIRVKDREFGVHRLILRARTPVFDAMLSHNMEENNKGVITVEDSDPEVFGDFLLFVYSGRVENLSCVSACELYYTADKYDLPELKEICARFLKESLSIETICDIVCLAARHSEDELLEMAIQFFVRNVEEILTTVKWQLFLRENPERANELFIKAVKHTKELK